ncbi:MAG TPA: riboflavin synthase, partial [Bacteroidota bacterium]|nr:riboflavin synthase [Bacteroidota bacterium]
MFTGIVTEVGRIARAVRQGGKLVLTVQAPATASELRINDSVAISGVCQTVVATNGHSFTVEAVEETLRKTTLGNLRVNSAVNLELPMRLDQRIGGHLVLGHVDGVGTVRSVVERDSSWLFTIEIPRQFQPYVIPVGSIAFDGVSLTVAEVQGNLVTVSIIPHTFKNTTFQYLKTGDPVNIELDVVGKYIHRLLHQ